MDGNSSAYFDINITNLTEIEKKLIYYYTIDCLYILFGCISIISNSIIIAVFLFNQQLRNRKELLLLVGLAIADLIFSVAYVTIGYNRIFAAAVYRDRVARFECLRWRFRN